MAYVTLTDGGKQIFGFDSANSSNLSISLNATDIKTAVNTLEAALEVAQQMAAAFHIDTSATTSTTSGSTTSGSTTSGGSVSSGGTVTSGTTGG